MTRKLLAVGVNAYPPPYQLQYAVNDAKRWESFCLRYLSGMQIMQGWLGRMETRRLLDSAATKANILAEFGAMIAGARPGDSLIFYLSGHGAQISDTSSDEGDQLDEVLGSVDILDYQILLDDDIRAIASNLVAGATLDIVLDICHAGTATRFADLNKGRIKSIPLLKGKVKRPKIGENMNHALWAACTEAGLSIEADGYGGVFSYFLVRALSASPTSSRQNIIASVRSNIAAAGFPQVPQLECPTSMATRAICR